MDTLCIAHDDVNYFTSPVDNKGYLSFYLGRDGTDSAGQVTGDDLTVGYPAMMNSLEALNLAGFEATGFSLYSLYDSCLV